MLPVIFDNSDFVVIHKPQAMSFHSESGAGVVALLEEQMGIELFSVHRLDKITSGILLFAKSSEVARDFSEMFASKTIEKYYIAISTRMPKKKQGWIKGDMTLSRRGSYKLLGTSNNPAITRFISTSIRPHERLFLIKPYTGKTHQIRVALKSLGSPIAGDERYAQADEARKEDRGYLHAYALRFRYKEAEYIFVQPPDFGERFLTPEFQAQVELWNQPWEYFIN